MAYERAVTQEDMISTIKQVRRDNPIEFLKLVHKFIPNQPIDITQQSTITLVLEGIKPKSIQAHDHIALPLHIDNDSIDEDIDD